MDSVLIICEEDAQDMNVRQSIRLINQAAFGRSEEADLIDRLRAAGVVVLSLIAGLNQRTVGHILFTRIFIETTEHTVPTVALAPVAVEPDYQRRQIGGRLIQEGLHRLRERGEKIVLLVGHPHYYPKFGFSTEKAATLKNPFPREAFMALELSTGALEGISGTVKYPPAFGLSSVYTT